MVQSMVQGVVLPCDACFSLLLVLRSLWDVGLGCCSINTVLQNFWFVWGQTRGMAMNPVDHPHGGGRGKRKGRISQTPWGKPTKGYKTRKPRNPTDSFIHLRRHAAKKAR